MGNNLVIKQIELSMPNYSPVTTMKYKALLLSESGNPVIIVRYKSRENIEETDVNIDWAICNAEANISFFEFFNIIPN